MRKNRLYPRRRGRPRVMPHRMASRAADATMSHRRSAQREGFIDGHRPATLPCQRHDIPRRWAMSRSFIGIKNEIALERRSGRVRFLRRAGGYCHRLQRAWRGLDGVGSALQMDRRQWARRVFRPTAPGQRKGRPDRRSATGGEPQRHEGNGREAGGKQKAAARCRGKCHKSRDNNARMWKNWPASAGMLAPNSPACRRIRFFSTA